MGAASVIEKFKLGIITNNYSDSILEVYNTQSRYNKQADNASNTIRKNLGWDTFTDKLIKSFKDVWKRT